MSKKRLDLLKIAAAREAGRNGVGRALRISAGLSLREVAAEVGVTDASVVSRWERGERRPRGHAAERYADLLEQLARRGREVIAR